jgi:hypothetical protein
MENEVAGQEPVEKPEELNNVPTAPTEQEMADLQSKYEALEAEKQQLEVEKENYRKGMLKAKGKIVEDDYTPPEDDEERIRRIIREENTRSNSNRVADEQKQIVQQLLAKNKELAHALKNKPTAGSGSGAGEPVNAEVKDNFFSAEQLAEIKAKGLDPAKVKANFLKYKV